MITRSYRLLENPLGSNDSFHGVVSSAPAAVASHQAFNESNATNGRSPSRSTHSSLYQKDEFCSLSTASSLTPEVVGLQNDRQLVVKSFENGRAQSVLVRWDLDKQAIARFRSTWLQSLQKNNALRALITSTPQTHPWGEHSISPWASFSCQPLTVPLGLWRQWKHLARQLLGIKHPPKAMVVARACSLPAMCCEYRPDKGDFGCPAHVLGAGDCEDHTELTVAVARYVLATYYPNKPWAVAAVTAVTRLPSPGHIKRRGGHVFPVFLDLTLGSEAVYCLETSVSTFPGLRNAFGKADIPLFRYANDTPIPLITPCHPLVNAMASVESLSAAYVYDKNKIYALDIRRIKLGGLQNIGAMCNNKDKHIRVENGERHLQTGDDLWRMSIPPHSHGFKRHANDTSVLTLPSNLLENNYHLTLDTSGVLQPSVDENHTFLQIVLEIGQGLTLNVRGLQRCDYTTGTRMATKAKQSELKAYLSDSESGSGSSESESDSESCCSEPPADKALSIYEHNTAGLNGEDDDDDEKGQPEDVKEVEEEVPRAINEESQPISTKDTAEVSPKIDKQTGKEIRAKIMDFYFAIEDKEGKPRPKPIPEPLRELFSIMFGPLPVGKKKERKNKKKKAKNDAPPEEFVISNQMKKFIEQCVEDSVRRHLGEAPSTSGIPETKAEPKTKPKKPGKKPGKKPEKKSGKKASSETDEPLGFTDIATLKLANQAAENNYY